ncbi:MAG: hypothetical protein OHK0029_35840 [Armatimonadaceae bacterium]
MLDEWVEKAEADYQAAIALNRRRVRPLPDIVCYHCSQCVEKYLKVFLVSHGEIPPRIHDLPTLLDLCLLHDGRLAAVLALVHQLNPYGVLVRYPGFSTDIHEARDAVDATRRVRRRIRYRLRL